MSAAKGFNGIRARARAASALLGATMILPPIVLAEGWHGAVGLTTDYVFRGVSQTQGDPAVQADLHYEGTPGGFAGVWASSIDPAYDSYGSTEVDLYAGWNWAIGADLSARFAYVRYLYPEANDIDYDYSDLNLRLAWRDRVIGTVAWSPDLVRFATGGYRERGSGYAYEIALRQPLGSRFAATAGAGYYDQLFGVEYVSWNAGLSCMSGPLEVDLSYFYTDDDAATVLGADAAGERWALTALWRF
jgi:uncharacterized protein (TIGR02001 family)